MKDNDKSIRVSPRAYKFLKAVKQKTGISIKRIIDDFIDTNIKIGK
jgi:hypothetical protein